MRLDVEPFIQTVGGILNFEQLIGLQSIRESFMRPVMAGRIVHAYLLAGPRGTGKKTVADIVARALNCEDPVHRPCDVCPRCRRFLTGNDTNLIRIRPEKSSIGVDVVRALAADLALAPYEGGYYAVIMERADAMTPQAQNALLKTLEEPPAHVVFFLLTESENALLPTIRSRVRIVRFTGVTDEACQQALIAHGVPPDRARQWAECSGGSVGDALSFDTDATYAPLRARVLGALEALRGPQDVASAFSAIQGDKDRANDVLAILELRAQDLMRVQAGACIAETSAATALQRSSIDGVRLMTAILQARKRLGANVSWQNAMEMLFLELLEREKE